MPHALTPSEFMRKLHPEYYSDSSGRTAYELDRETFEYHLESITSRNETHEFEIFCRKLCERVICPNLRPATGPEGGGDSKADTETFAVAEEIAQFYIGRPGSGSERWAFAFSAKETWRSKVTSDVADLIATGRNYDRIVCVTSRFARAKKRALLEDELTKEHGVPVEIHDRSWLVKEVIEHDRRFLAFHYLGIGREVTDLRPLGPEDYSRSQDLEDIEASLEDAASFRGMELQTVIDALLAAKLSRALERPRTETNGRFERAKHLARKFGTRRQQLEIHYEALLTAFWWFDDIELLNSSYDEFEAMLEPDEHMKNVEFLSGLHQLLVVAVIHGHLTMEAVELTDRMDRLRDRLEKIEADPNNPNSALAATTSLLILKLNRSKLLDRTDDMTDLWARFSDILEKAKSLGEFDADGLVRVIKGLAQVAGNNAEYNALIEKTAEFVKDRVGEAEAARMLIERAKQLEPSKTLECIRLIGKAIPYLTKGGLNDDLVEPLALLALAYRQAEVYWAARSSCLMAIATITAQFNEDGVVSPLTVWAIEVWAWTSLQLRHFPDLLCALRLLDAVFAERLLSEKALASITKKREAIETALAACFVHLPDDDIARLDNLADCLERGGLFVARMALLYSLGHSQHLRDEGGIPEEAPDEEIATLFSMFASQTVSDHQTPPPAILNADEHQTFQTKVVGLTLAVRVSGTQTSILVAEAILTSMEAYLATALDRSIMPHTEGFSIEVSEISGIAEPAFDVDPFEMRASIRWPEGHNPAQAPLAHNAIPFLMNVAASVLATTSHVGNLDELLSRLHADERVGNRIAMVLETPNFYSRILGRPLTRLADLVGDEDDRFPLRDRPKLERLEEETAPDEATRAQTPTHRSLSVRSVVDMPLWDEAVWRGAGYASMGPKDPPVVLLLFENRQAAERIFARWRHRFGRIDDNEAIHLAVIRGVSQEAPHRYVCLVTSSPAIDDRTSTGDASILAGSQAEIDAETSTNLETFIKDFRVKGCYLLAPAVFRDGRTEPLMKHAILKRHFVVRHADDVGPNDVEAMALPN